MVFASLTFIFLFLPILLVVYYVTPSIKLKNIVLLVFSLIFYSWGEPIFVVLLIFSTLNDYYHSLYIDKYKKQGRNDLTRRLLISSIVINLGLLFYFKYTNFMIDNINAILHTGFTVKKIALPIGISFYTFQTMSYTIDVYRGNVKAQKNILTLGAYVALFPQLVAGPIVRYIDVENELDKRSVDFTVISNGLRRFIIGLGKKVIIANTVATIAVEVFDKTPIASLNLSLAWVGLLAYTIQIYFDFSGYSDMAIGLGQMFGFNFPENFNYPYISRSITDFWRRWHISLGTWFREYVYIPLGGNRVSTIKWIRNICIVWFLTGFWHGASWNFTLWGLYFAFFLVVEKLFLGKYLKKIGNFSMVYSVLIFTLGWVIFRVQSVELILKFTNQLFNFNNIGNLELLKDKIILHNIVYLGIGIIGATPVIKYLFNYLNYHRVIPLQYFYDFIIFGILLLSVMYLVSDSFNPFIYFEF